MQFHPGSILSDCRLEDPLSRCKGESFALSVQKETKKKPQTETKLPAVCLKVSPQYHNSQVNSQIKIISCECLPPIGIHPIVFRAQDLCDVSTFTFPCFLGYYLRIF